MVVHRKNVLKNKTERKNMAARKPPPRRKNNRNNLRGAGPAPAAPGGKRKGKGAARRAKLPTMGGSGLTGLGGTGAQGMIP